MAQTAPTSAQWQEMSSKLPWQKNSEDLKRRRALWTQFDKNGNGVLSLAEVDAGLNEVLDCKALFDSKPVLLRAFNAAKNLSGDQSGTLGDFVEFKEFRTLLYYLRQYFEYWVMFSRIDTSSDRRLNYEEFKMALDQIEDWGIIIDDAKAAFEEIDEDGHGMILFDEFSNWAIKKQLDLQDDDETDGSPELREQEKFDAQKTAKARIRAYNKKQNSEEKKQPDLHTLDVGVWERLSEKIPFRDTKEDREARKRAWKGADMNNNGILSLAEVDRAVMLILGSADLFNAKPVLIRAFNAAKGGNSKGHEDYIDRKEFRTLMWYLKQYFEYWVMFKTLDQDQDGRIGFEEFKACLAAVSDFGLQVTDPEAAFAECDADGGGKVLFDEFANWAISKHLDADGGRDDAHAVELKEQKLYGGNNRSHSSTARKTSPRKSPSKRPSTAPKSGGVRKSPSNKSFSSSPSRPPKTSPVKSGRKSSSFSSSPKRSTSTSRRSAKTSPPKTKHTARTPGSARKTAGKLGHKKTSPGKASPRKIASGKKTSSNRKQQKVAAAVEVEKVETTPVDVATPDLDRMDSTELTQAPQRAPASASSSHLKVVCRLREPEDHEENPGLRYDLKTNSITVVDKGRFEYDHLFDHSISQDEIYELMGSPLVSRVLDGINATVLAYGMTGSGKSYTLVGDSAEGTQGLLPRASDDLFKAMAQPAFGESSVVVSFFEVYKEGYYDLLNRTRKQLQLRFSQEYRRSRLVGLQEVPVANTAELLAQYHKAAALSRCNVSSHCFFEVTLRRRLPGTIEQTYATMTFVDLADNSENSFGVTRSSRPSSPGRGKSSEEEQKARGYGYQSLLTLMRVVRAISEGRQHVPFRESELTRVLQASLGGNCDTSIVLAVCPLAANYKQTLATLQFGAFAKNITADVIPNVVQVEVPVNTLLVELNQACDIMRDIKRHDEEQIFNLTAENEKLTQERDEQQKIAYDQTKLAKEGAAAAAAASAALARAQDELGEVSARAARLEESLNTTLEQLKQERQRLEVASEDATNLQGLVGREQHRAEQAEENNMALGRTLEKTQADNATLRQKSAKVEADMEIQRQALSKAERDRKSAEDRQKKAETRSADLESRVDQQKKALATMKQAWEEDKRKFRKQPNFLRAKSNNISSNHENVKRRVNEKKQKEEAMLKHAQALSRRQSQLDRTRSQPPQAKTGSPGASAPGSPPRSSPPRGKLSMATRAQSGADGVTEY